MMINKRLISQVKETKKYIALIVFINWLGLICNISIIFNIAFIFNDLFLNNFDNILKKLVFIIIFIILKMFCNILAGKFSYNTSVKVKEILREKIYKKLLNIGASYNETLSTSEILQVSVEGVEQLEIYFGKYLPQLFYSLLAPLTLFIVITPISFMSALVLLICVPLIPMSIIVVQKFAKKLFGKYWKEYTSLGDGFLDKLQGITTLKIYNADEQKNEEMNKQAEVFRKITMKVLVMQLNSVTIMDLVAFGGAALGVILAVSQAYLGNISFTFAIVIILLASEFFIPLRLLGSFFHIAMNGMSASEKMFKIIDIENKKENTKTIENGNIRFKNVDFFYKDKKALNNINIEIKEKSLVAIAGKSGSGKSTIASIIMTLKKGYKGSITISEKELDEINEENLMQNITLVNHNSYIFKGTIEENLKMAKKEATKQQMEEVLAKVDLLDFVKNQGGLNFALAEKGSNLSGGQAQRLALARAILHDSKIYIFDEATSNIDIESESIIMQNIYNLAKEKAVLLISHRLANIVKADNIYVIENGEIVEQGTHNKLMEERNIYYALYEKQQMLEQYSKEAF